jgi:hypothetical protein
MSVSIPSFTQSAQEGLYGSKGSQAEADVRAAQTPARQLPVAQSASTSQVLPSAHGGQASPPQSTSVSIPSFTQSAQLGDPGVTGSHVARVAAQRPLVHVPLAQSAPSLQALPSAHGGQASPPQSTSVSVPFLTPSAHVGCAGAPPVPAQAAPEPEAPPDPRPLVCKAQDATADSTNAQHATPTLARIGPS